MNKITNFLRGWALLTRAVEGVLIDNIAATVPWLAPVVPAWLAYHNMTGVLGMPSWIGLVGAAVVEFLGLSTVSTAFSLWEYNDARRKTDHAAPLWVAIITAGFYLAVVLTVNVILDAAPPVERLAKGLLSTLSIAAAVTLATRAQHARRLQAAADERAERREMRKERKEKHAGNLPETFRNFPEVSETFRNSPDWRHLGLAEREAIAEMSTAAIVERYGVDDRTARNWRTKAINNGWHETVKN